MRGGHERNAGSSSGNGVGGGVYIGDGKATTSHVDVVGPTGRAVEPLPLGFWLRRVLGGGERHPA